MAAFGNVCATRPMLGRDAHDAAESCRTAQAAAHVGALREPGHAGGERNSRCARLMSRLPIWTYPRD